MKLGRIDLVTDDDDVMKICLLLFVCLNTSVNCKCLGKEPMIDNACEIAVADCRS